MASPLSEELLSGVYDSGYKSLPYASTEGSRAKRSALAGSSRFRLSDLLYSADPQELIPSLAPQDLYLALTEQGLEDSVDLLPYLSQDQFVRIMDYDIWTQDSLNPKQAIRWLLLYHSIEPAQMYERFRGLDEEYQMALLAPFIRVYDQEAYEKLSDEEQDRLYSLPRDSLHYSILTEDDDLSRGIEELINSCMAEDMEYTLRLLLHCAYDPPNEACEQMKRFRMARLEEDGFVSYEESLSCFEALPVGGSSAVLANDFSMPLEAGGKDPQMLQTTPIDDGSSFLEKTLVYGKKQVWSREEAESLQSGFLHLANSLCAASQVDPGDTQALRFLLENTEALCSFALEQLSNGKLSLACKLLAEKYPKVLFRTALGLVESLRGEVLLTLDTRFPKEVGSASFTEPVRHFLRLKKFGLVLDWMDIHLRDKIGFENCEVLKGLFNRYPVGPLKAKDHNRIFFTPISSVAEFRSLADKIRGFL